MLKHDEYFVGVGFFLTFAVEFLKSENMKTLGTFVISITLLASCASINQMKKDREQMTSDIRELLNQMDDSGDLDRYDGSDAFIRLYEYTHQ